ncbi:MAG TPA: transcriptional repressor LexA [bacterium]|nr:transcriptional repressor LexA [bacterium]
MTLTPKQQDLLTFVQTFLEDRGFAPSQREIAEHFGFRSLGTVQNYLKALEAKGYLAKAKHQSRALRLSEVTDIDQSAIAIPLLGRVAAGQPIEAIENRRTVEVPPALLRGGENFALEVRGDSMIEEGIREGDLVVVRRQQHAENGQIVIAMLDGEATVKKFFWKNGEVELRPANAALKPIYVNSGQGFQILGLVVGLIRKYL